LKRIQKPNNLTINNLKREDRMSVQNVAFKSPIPIVVEKSPSLLKKIWRKICEIAKKIFNFFRCCKKPSHILSDRQISIIEKAREKAKQVIPTPPPQPEALQPLIPGKTESKIKADVVIEDPCLKQLIGTLSQFSSVIIDCVNKEKIAPSIVDLKETAANFPDTAKVWVKMFMEVIKYLKPIFERFTKADEPLLMPLIQLLCTVLLENKKQSEIEEALNTKLNELLTKKVISEELYKRLSTAIQPAINWIIQSNNLLLKSIDPIQLHELIIDTRDFTLKLSKMLITGELDEEIEEIQKIISEHIQLSLPALLENNNKQIIQFIGARIADLTQNLPYTTTFDDLTDRVNNHLAAWVHANNKHIEEKETIRATKLAVESYPPNIDQNLKLQQQEYLDIIEEEGGEKPYLAKKFITEFKNFFVAKNPDSVMLLSQPPPGMTAESMEEDVYNIFAEKIYRLLFPSARREFPFEIRLEQDGLADIWDRITLPDPLKQVQDKLEMMFEKILNTKNLLNEKNFKTYFFVILKTVVIYYIRQNKIMPVIKKGVQNVFEKYSNPSSIEELFSENIVPTAIDKIFELFARQAVSNNLDTFAPLFCSLIEAPENRVLEAKKTLITKLEEVMIGKFVDFKLDMLGTSKVTEIVQPIIIEITQVLLNLKEIEPTKTLVDKEVAEAIKKYYVSEEVEAKKEFGEIVNKLLFDIGNFNKSFSGWIISFFPGTLAQVATAGFKDYRSSYHALVNSIIGVLKKQYMDYDHVKSTFFDEEKSDEELKLINEKVKQELPAQYKALAAETHDLLYDKAGFAYRYLIPKTEVLDSTIKRIFRKLFKREQINKHLIYQIFTVLDNGFANSVVRSACNVDLKNKVSLIAESN
jgi:hypothetical protein